MFDGEVAQLSEILLTLLTLNGVPAELLPELLDIPVELLLDGLLPELLLDGLLPELLEDGLIPELLEDWREPEGEPVLAEVPDSVPFTRTWCPTSFSSLEVSPCS